MNDDLGDEIRSISFEYYHDQFHAIGSPTCWRRYGGPRRHVALWWEYRASEWLRARTVCRLNRHRWVSWRRRDVGTREVVKRFTACRDCARRVQPVVDGSDDHMI